MHPRRGEVWWVAFDPAVGGEIQKTRPAVIVSNNAANTVLNRVIAVPLTSQIAKVYGRSTHDRFEKTYALQAGRTVRLRCSRRGKSNPSAVRHPPLTQSQIVRGLEPGRNDKHQILFRSLHA